eukprot:TRINITY_DN2256_c0_g1_i4.p1 TRINITY_DN2256_c0_g1~~TRINITY_DN2256_c0_g1_i4.p1  ORF type:complete len:845 (-),score=222.00 TRINITY_DN2256_c0_g1_i4:219-2753(-)
MMNQSNPAYPFHRFKTGNIESLVTIPKARGIDVQQRLVQFFNTYYSANIMNLVVLGNESLPILEGYVKEHFSNIPNKKISRPFIPGPLLTPSDFKKYMKVVSQKDAKLMFLYFQFPKKATDFSYRPTTYVCEFLGNKGAGSIYSYLRKKGWADKLRCRKYHEADEYFVLEVEIELTEAGFQKHIDQTLEVFFYYVSLMAKSLPTESWRYEQSAAIARFRALHKSRGRLPNFISSTARNMQQYGEFSIFGPRMYSRWNSKITSELFSRVLQHITPDRVRIHLVSNTYANETGIIQESIYGVKFSPQVLTDDRIKKWTNPAAVPELSLPQKNPFVDVDSKPKQTPRMNTAEVMVNNSIIEFWYQTDNRRPQVILRAFFQNKEISSTSQNFASAELFVRLVKDTLSSVHFDASLAGLYFSIEPKANGIELLISGNRRPVSLLLGLIWKGLKKPRMDATSFEIFRKEQMVKFQNQVYGAPHKRVRAIAAQLLHTPFYTSKQMLKALNNTKLADVQSFYQNIFLKSKIIGFATGNLLPSEIRDIISDLNSTFTATLKPTGAPIESASVVVTKLKPGSDLVYLENLNVTNDVNSCILVTYQIPLLDRAATMKLVLLHSMLDKPFYNQLRTAEQLGYIVQTSLAANSDAGEIQFIIVSEKSPSYLLSRIQYFLNNTTKTRLEKMSDKEFSAFRQALYSSRSLDSSSKTLIWNEILSKKYAFGQKKLDAQVVLSISKANMIEFFNENIISKKRKLSIELLGSKATENQILPGQTVINDPDEFKAAMSSSSFGTVSQEPSQSYSDMNRTPTLAIVLAMMSIVVVLVLGAASYAAYSRYHNKKKYMSVSPHGWD